jgi:YVTN family beta-propeller protein
MNLLKGRRGWVIGAFVGYAVLALGFSAAYGANFSPGTGSVSNIGIADFTTPTYSSPIALSADNSRIWVVNPDDDSVSVIDPSNDTVVGNFRVGDEPQSVALDLNGNAYVANAASNNVSILSPTGSPLGTLTSGAEPWNIVASPNGQRVFVANSGQDTITVIRSSDRTIVGNIDIQNSACNDPDRNRRFQPRGMAVTLDNSKLYVTRFLSFTKAGGQQGTDNGKEGVVCRIDLPASVTTLPTQFTPIRLASQDTGFPAKVGTPPVDTLTSAYPNQMQSIVIHGDQAYLPNIASSPAGPLKFDVDTHAFVNVIDGVTGGSQTDAGAAKSKNLHLGARLNNPKVFFANVWAMAFTSPAGAGSAYVVSAGSDGLVKVNVDAVGAINFTGGVSNTTFIDLNNPADAATSGTKAGKNPLGIVIRNLGAGNNKAYVMNYISRNVSVVNLDSDTVLPTITLTSLPTPGSQEEQIHVGAEMFFSSRGVFNGGAKTNRLSANGWQNCASCHFAGLTDGNVWTFGAGPRKSVPLNGTWNPHDPDDQRVLNYSAIFDEVQDFELNIRNVSGPGNDPVTGGFRATHGLLISDTGDINTPPAVINAFLKANAGRPQLTVTLPNSSKAWPALDALKEWVRFGVRTPNGALTTAQLTAGGGNSAGGLNNTDVDAGRKLFFQAGCQTCHGGGKWTNSFKDFGSPPAGTQIATETAGALPPPGGSQSPPAGVTPIGTQFLFADAQGNRYQQNINSFNLGVLGKNKPVGGPGGPEVGAFERANANNITGDAGPLAIGTDHNGDGRGEGYNVPSLLGIHLLQPYYHNGSCETLACVMSNADHRTKGLRPSQADPFDNTASGLANRTKVIAFLESLDAETNPITNLYVKSHDLFLDPSAPIAGDSVTPGANLSIFGPNINFNDLIGKPIKVKFTIFKFGASTPISPPQEKDVTAFTVDFGQQSVLADTPIILPDAGRYVLEVFVDSGGDFPEERERDNIARRTFTVRPAPPDKTAPVIVDGSTVINDDAVISPSRDVNIKFKADDPAGPAGQSISGLDSFCIVRYYYSGVQRRWVEERCDFRQLPAKGTDGSYEVKHVQLPDTVGVGYAFVWVKDKAGNISKKPGFDFINIIPSGERSIGRNDVRIFRIRVSPGQSLSLTVTPTAGTTSDVDTTVFQGFTSPVRCDVSAISNGTTPETVTVPSVLCPGTEFQIEVRAVVNSRFSVTTALALAGLTRPQASGVGPAGQASSDPAPQVAGPPALQTAIDGGALVYLPVITR